MEAIVAVGLLATAAVALASLSSIAIRANSLARERTLAALYTSQKLEALSHRPAALVPSPSDTLTRDADGFVEHLDGGGRHAAPRDGFLFVRRWQVTALPQDPELVRITVEVTPCRRSGPGGACRDASARVQLSTVRSRLVW